MNRISSSLERRIRMFALQFGNQSVFLFMIHDCTHKSSKVLLPTLFFVLFNFFMWYHCFHHHLVCNGFTCTTFVLNSAIMLNLPGFLEIIFRGSRGDK